MTANARFASTQPTHGCPQSHSDSESRRLRVTVVFTTIEGTLSALETAGNLAQELGAEILLLVTEVVSFRHRIENPPGDWRFFERLCNALLDESIGPNTRSRFEVHFCRDASGCLKQTLAPHSLVLVGASRRWWPRLERDLQRTLIHLGHEALLVPCSVPKAPAKRVVERLLKTQSE